MSGKSKAAAGSRKLILAIVFILVVNLSLGFLLTRQSGGALTALMHTRMLDVSNTAAAMLDGDALARLTPADEGTPDYEAVMRTLGVFQDSIALQYIYCVRDMGDGTFTFGLDPTVSASRWWSPPPWSQPAMGQPPRTRRPTPTPGGPFTAPTARSLPPTAPWRASWQWTSAPTGTTRS